MRDPLHIPTGTGPARRRLTLQEAERGALPEPTTDAEWAALHRASVTQAELGAWRIPWRFKSAVAIPQSDEPMWQALTTTQETPDAR